MIGRVRDRGTFEELRRRGRRVRRGPVTLVHLPSPDAATSAVPAPPGSTIPSVAPTQRTPASTPSTRPGPPARQARTVPAGQPPVRVAYGVGRKVGNAVARNRVRRRLRAILHELDRESRSTGAGTDADAEAAPGHAARGRERRPGLVPGAYLVTVRPEAAELPYDELRHHVTAAVEALSGAAASPGSSGASPHRPSPGPRGGGQRR